MFKGLLLTLTLISNTYGLENKSICGIDNRIPSNTPEIGRLLNSLASNGGCTVTMISPTCAISAGHCHSTFKFAQFNTPESIKGKIQHPKSEDIYEIDTKSIKAQNKGLGDDWAVLKILPNKITGLNAGDRQGYYEVAFERPLVGDIVRITGYGSDELDPTRHFAQQTHSGEVVNNKGGALSHIADTMGGNSGSTIIRERDQKIVAIHTNGGCYRSRGNNKGTIISGNLKLENAVKSCLANEY